MSDDLTVLTVGTEVETATSSVGWTDEYNVKDYDWIFLDYYTLEKRVRGSSIQSEFSEQIDAFDSNDIERAIITGSKIIVFISEKSYISTGQGTKITPINSVPIKTNLIKQEGKSLDKDGVIDEWEWYFDQPYKYSMTLSPEIIRGKIAGVSYESNPKPIATNTSMETLALQAEFSVTADPTGSSEKKAVDGMVYLLPVLPGWQTDDLVREILDRFTKFNVRIKTEESPEWAEGYTLPGESDAKHDLKNLRQEKKEIEEQITEQEGKVSEFEKYKILLWGNEGTLEALVPKVFREMGLKTEGEQKHGRDGLIITDELRLVLEITGTKNDISDNKCRQLSAWVDDVDLEDDSNDYTGLLVVNPQCNTNPSDRNKSDFLPSHLQTFLEKRGFRVLLTPRLYEIFGEYRPGNIDTSDVEELLLEDGLFV